MGLVPTGPGRHPADANINAPATGGVEGVVLWGCWTSWRLAYGDTTLADSNCMEWEG